jgi:peptidyl-prolyl cis-trans isomerase SurA
MTDPRRLYRLVALTVACLLFAPVAQAQTGASRGGDHIVAIVNQELVTAREIEQRMTRAREEARRGGQTLPPESELRQQVLDVLIEERVLITHARDSGQKVDEAELDRAVTNIAAQNQLTMPQLRERLRRDGVEYSRFRNQLRDQLIVERLREREVQSRIRITDADVDAFLEKRRNQAQPEYNIAQLLITVPEGADEATVAQRRALAETALKRALAGEPFDALARELSEDGNRQRGGEIGMRPADRLPDIFVERVRSLDAGRTAPALLRSPAGFHVLKLVERRDANSVTVTQTRARHILLRLSAQMKQDAAIAQLAAFKHEIESGAKKFDAVARASSEDGSAPQGGDLGWVSPGSFVPEFEEAMNALPLNGISEPVVSRFGVHLIQVVERRNVTLDARQVREQARNMLREQKFDEAYNDWLQELRARAYVEMREPPQ